MDHDGYDERFRKAEEKSRRWAVQFGPAFGVQTALTSGTAYDALPTIGQVIDSPVFAHWDSLDIRLHCAEIHMSMFANQHHWRGSCVLTVGDVEVDGKCEYGTTYPQLRQELRGERRNVSKSYPCHVWLTFPDMHIIDLTFFVYRYYDRVPSPWKWSDYILCSDPRCELSTGLLIRYLPMLVGQRIVNSFIA